jgi:hypothetical protein
MSAIHPDLLYLLKIVDKNSYLFRKFTFREYAAMQGCAIATIHARLHRLVALGLIEQQAHRRGFFITCDGKAALLALLQQSQSSGHGVE